MPYIRPFTYALIISLILAAFTVPAQQPTASFTELGLSEDDLVLTVRLSPEVSPKTIELLNRITVPKTVRLQAGQNVKSFLKQFYGSFFTRIEARVRAMNPAWTTDVAAQPLELKLPAGAKFYENVVKTITLKNKLTSFSEALKEQSRLERGTDVKQAISEIQKSTEARKNFCKSQPSACTQFEKDKLIKNQAVIIPLASRYVSFRIKPENKSQIPEILMQLKKDAGVSYAEVHSPSRLIPHFTSQQLTALGAGCGSPATSTDWFINSLSLNKLSLDAFQQSNKATIAILDSGIDMNDQRFSLWSNLPEASGLDGWDDDANGYMDDKVGCNFIAQGSYPTDDQFFDDSYRNHGTHVAGLASGRFLSGALLTEANRRLQTMILKIADSQAFVDNGAVNDAILYAQNKNAAIINMSFQAAYSASIEKYIREDKNRLYVIAAGNGDAQHVGLDLDLNPRFPANLASRLDNVISVAAHNESNRLACFSNFGEKSVDVAAPGVEIESTVADDGLLKLSGTSQAAPLVSFAAALIYSQGISEPSLIKQRVLTSVDFIPEYRNKLTSEGKLNIAKAVSVFDDLIELNDAAHTLLRGKFVNPPKEIIVEGTAIPFRAIKKIVNFSPENGAVLQRITFLDKGELKTTYGNISIPPMVLKDGDECRTIKLEEISDVIPALVPSSQPATCPSN